MPDIIKAENGSEAYRQLLRRVRLHGSQVAPRGLKSRELTDTLVMVPDATQTVPQLTRRLMRRRIGATEYVQLLAGASCLEQLDTASGNRFSQFADHGKLAGAYGPRIWQKLPAVAELLNRDPDSRQGVIVIWDGTELVSPSRDVPCTVGLIFRVRDGRLTLTVLMRSSDAWLGIPYDWWQFSRLQMTMAWALDVPAGTFTFFAGSLHLYERDMEHAEAAESSDVASGIIPAITGEEGSSLPASRIATAQRAALQVMLGLMPEYGTGLEFYQGLVPCLSQGASMCRSCRYVTMSAENTATRLTYEECKECRST